MSLKVKKSDPYASIEEEIMYTEIALDDLEWVYGLPKWAYLNSEWGTYVSKKVALQRQLRKLQAELGYTNNVAELVH